MGLDKFSFAFLAGLVSFLSLVSAHVGDVGSASDGCMMGSFFGGMGFGVGLFGWLFMLLVLVSLVLFIVWMIKMIQEPKKK